MRLRTQIDVAAARIAACAAATSQLVSLLMLQLVMILIANRVEVCTTRRVVVCNGADASLRLRVHHAFAGFKGRDQWQVPAHSRRLALLALAGCSNKVRGVYKPGHLVHCRRRRRWCRLWWAGLVFHVLLKFLVIFCLKGISQV